MIYASGASSGLGFGVASEFADSVINITNQQGGKIVGADYGVQTSAGGDVITNAGTIAAGSYDAGTGAITVGGSNAVNLGAAGSIVNTSTGLIESDQDAVYASNGLALLNAGTIASISQSSVAAQSTAAVITNAAGGALIGGADPVYGYGVQLASESGVINNYGSITGSAGGVLSSNNFGDSDGVTGATVNLLAGSITGAINLSGGVANTVAIYSALGTANAGLVDIGTGIQLQNAGTLSAASYGILNGGGHAGSTIALRGTATGTAASGAAGTFDLGQLGGAVSGFDTITKLDSGTWTITGTVGGGVTINVGDGGVPGAAGVLNFDTTGLTSDITLNGTIKALRSGAFGTGTIYAVDPTIEFGATGTYANPIVLQSTNPVTDPTRLLADAGVNATLTGAITEGIAGQPLVIDGSDGTGTITLTNGGNTYTGSTTITAGTLALTGAGSIATSSGLTNNGVFDISGHTGDTSVGGLSGTGSTVLGANSLTLSNAAGIYSGAVSGTGGLTLAAGAETLSGANTYTGATTITSGTLTLGGSGSIASSSGLTNNGTFDISGHTGNAAIVTLSGTGATVLGANTLTLSNAAGSYSGAASGTGGLTIAAGAESLSGVSTYSGATTIANGATLSLTGTGAIASSAVVANGGFNISGHTGGATVASLSGGGGVTLGANTLSLSNAAGSYTGVMSGTGGLTVAGGSETLTGQETYTGATTIAAGTLALSTANAITATSGVALTVATSILDLTANSQTINNLSGVAGSQVRLGGGSKGTIYTYSLNSTANTLFAGVISGGGIGFPFSGTANLLKDGTGTLTLTGANTFTGPLTINAGTLALSGGGSISSVTSVTNNATLDISGHTGTAAINSLSGSTAGVVTLGANTLTLTAAAGTYDGALNGTGGLAITGGTETLTAATAYTGGTSINAGGGLALSGNGSISNSFSLNDAGTFDITNVTGGSSSLEALQGAGSVILGANTLNLTGTGTAFSGFISGTGGVSITNDFAVFSGDNTYTGATTVNAGVLQLGSGGATGSVAGSIVLNGTATLSIFHNNAVNLFNPISGSGALQQSGTGVTTITGADTYTGPTRILAGTLALSGAGSIATSSSVINQAVFDISGVTGTTASVRNVSGTSAGVVNLGTKTLVISAGGATFASAANGTGGLTFAAGNTGITSVNTYTGTTTVNAGANLFLNANASIASSSGVI